MYDAILCRNMLIYLGDGRSRGPSVSSAARSCPAGTCFLGHSESLLDRATEFAPAMVGGRGLPEAGGRMIRRFRGGRLGLRAPGADPRARPSSPGSTWWARRRRGARRWPGSPAADPDLVTLDVAMPGMDGLQLLPALLRWKPSLRVLMLSAHTREGADGDGGGAGRRRGGLHRQDHAST